MDRSDMATESRDASAGARGRRGIRWLRVVIAGLAAEVALMVVAAAAYALPDPQRAIDIAIGPASFAAMALFGYWAARPLARLQPLHGLLTGAVGVLLYVVLMLGASLAPGAPAGAFAATLTPAYLLAHVLKLLGGWIGGTLAARAGRKA